MVSLAMDVLKHLPFVPNEQQALLVAAMCSFVGNGADRDVFVLNGYAGTGKTSVVGALIKTLAEHREARGAPRSYRKGGQGGVGAGRIPCLDHSPQNFPAAFFRSVRVRRGILRK